MRTSVLLLLVATAMGSPLAAQHKKRGRCNGAPPDSTWLIGGPIYMDCEVDKKVSLQSAVPPDFVPTGTPRTGCLRAEFEFVVDTSGQPEILTIRPHPGNDRDLEEAVRSSIPKLRFAPAELDGKPVRQLTVHKENVYIRRVSSRDALPPVGPPSMSC
jgi:hypothetical protein